MSDNYPHPGVYIKKRFRRPEYLGRPDPRIIGSCEGMVRVGMVHKSGKSRWMTDAELQSHRAAAQGIEAASAAETPKSGSVHESPVAKPCAQ